MTNRNNPNNNKNEDFVEELMPDLFPQEWYNKMDKVIDKTLSILDDKLGVGAYDASEIIKKIINHNVTKRLDEISEQLVEELELPTFLDWTEKSFDEIFDDVHCLVDAFSIKNMKIHKFFIEFGENEKAMRHYYLWKDCINTEYDDLRITERIVGESKISCTLRRLKNSSRNDEN